MQRRGKQIFAILNQLQQSRAEHPLHRSVLNWLHNIVPESHFSSLQYLENKEKVLQKAFTNAVTFPLKRLIHLLWCQLSVCVAVAVSACTGMSSLDRYMFMIGTRLLLSFHKIIMATRITQQLAGGANDIWKERQVSDSPHLCCSDPWGRCFSFACWGTNSVSVLIINGAFANQKLRSVQQRQERNWGGGVKKFRVALFLFLVVGFRYF